MSTVEEILDAVKELPLYQQAEIRRRLENLTAEPSEYDEAVTEPQQAAIDLDQRVQRALYDAGLLIEIKPPVKRPRERTPPIKIRGKPLSETIIEDRR